MVTAVLADRMRANFKNHKANASVAEGRSAPGGPKLILAKPNSFMNLSGGPVAGLLRFYSLDVSRLIVVHDELDLPFDTLKIKVGGGHGGHNGLRDIIAATGSNEFKLKQGFRALFGTSPFRLLTEIRMQKAWELLESGRRVSSVADQVGYRHLSSFSAAFERHHGRTPKSVARSG